MTLSERKQAKTPFGTQTRPTNRKWFLMDGGHDERDSLVHVSDADLVYRTRYVGRPSSAIIEAMATLEDIDPSNLPVLYHVIDLDALDRLYPDPGQMQLPAELSFSLCQYRFFLCTDGSIEVYELESAIENDGE